jgi:hypothetical protein
MARTDIGTSAKRETAAREAASETERHTEFNHFWDNLTSIPSPSASSEALSHVKPDEPCGLLTEPSRVSCAISRTDSEPTAKRANSVGTCREGGYRAGMTPHPTPWTTETVTAGLCGFYREIAGVGLVFPLAARPIAVEYHGYPVITLRQIEGLEGQTDELCRNLPGGGYRGLEVEEQLLPRSCALAHAVGEADQGRSL